MAYNLELMKKAEQAISPDPDLNMRMQQHIAEREAGMQALQAERDAAIRAWQAAHQQPSLGDWATDMARSGVQRSALGGIIGAILASRRSGFAKDRLRGAAKGVGTGLGSLAGQIVGSSGGALLGGATGGESGAALGGFVGNLAGLGAGAVAGYHGGGRLAEAVGLNTPSKDTADQGLADHQEYVARQNGKAKAAAHAPAHPGQTRFAFTPEEQQAIEHGKSRWLPDLIQNYSTPAYNMISSPGKGALLGALTGGAGGAALGYGLGHDSPQGPALPAAAFGAGGAGLGALLAYISAKQNNANVLELASHSPQVHPTKYDLAADPVGSQDRYLSTLSGLGAGMRGSHLAMLGALAARS